VHKWIHKLYCCAGVGSLPLGMPAELFAGVSGLSLPALQQGPPSLFGISPSGSGNGSGGLQSIELFQRSGLRPVGGSLPLHLPRSGAFGLKC
jgi:hypothetical protein